VRLAVPVYALIRAVRTICLSIYRRASESYAGTWLGKRCIRRLKVSSAREK